jgi:hypothetical protein
MSFGINTAQFFNFFPPPMRPVLLILAIALCATSVLADPESSDAKLPSLVVLDDKTFTKALFNDKEVRAELQLRRRRAQGSCGTLKWINMHTLLNLYNISATTCTIIAPHFLF